MVDMQWKQTQANPILGYPCFLLSSHINLYDCCLPNDKSKGKSKNNKEQEI